MSEVPIKLIGAIFPISILSLIGNIMIVSLNFALNYSGYNITIIVPGCTISYLNSKLAIVYLPLRAHTTSGLISICLAVPALILAIKMYWPLRELSPENLGQYKLNKKYIISFYILTCFEAISMVSNAGGKMSLYIDNKSCNLFS
jgi:hypothetical protein